MQSKAFAEVINGSVWRVSTSVATGASGGQPPLIELSPGYGVNISFIPTGETVEKVWFDNPSFATLDVDGCLSGLSGEQEQRECSAEGATILHLRRINPLDFPNLPKTNSTLLTVITRGSSGRRVYLFRVALGGKNPQYHTVEISPSSSIPMPNAPINHSSVIEATTNWQILNRGLAVAEQQRLIRRNQPLYVRIQNFLTKVRAGEPIESAAQTSGISLNLVKRLAQLGSTDTSVPAPTTSHS